MDNNKNNILAILGAIISVPYDLSLFYPLIQYHRQKIRAEQIPIRMYISFFITSTIVSARNIFFVNVNNTSARNAVFDDNGTDTNFIIFTTVASVSLAIIFISTMWLFWIKFRNRNYKTQILILFSLLITNFVLMIDIFLIMRFLKKLQETEVNTIGITVFQIVTTIVILINTIVPFPFDNFTQCDYKKVPFITVITGIFDNIGWIVITITIFSNESIPGTTIFSHIDILSFIANGGSLFLNIVHVLFYIYWKYKNDKKIDYTIVTEIK